MNGAGGRFRINHRGNGGGGGQRKEKDNDDLLLFKELHRREKDQAASLLQPFSDEFDINAGGTHHSFYRIPSGKKDGYEFFGGGGGHGKSDYDWLKTPPATPLFPSLEMEANRPELLIQREITVVQPLSRFAASPESGKARASSATTSPPTTATKSLAANSRPKIPTARSSLITANGQRPTLNSPPLGKPATEHQASPKHQPAKDRTTTTTTPPPPATTVPSAGKPNVKPVQQSAKPSSSRGMSPVVKSNIAVVAAAVATSSSSVTDHHPRAAISNSRPDHRASSTSRVRTKQQQLPGGQQRTTAVATTTATGKRRSSSSSSRPRLLSTTTSGEGSYVHHQRGKVPTSSSTQGGGRGSGGTQVFGSKMVDKVMSARKSAHQQHQEETVKGTSSVKIKPGQNVEGNGNGGDKAGSTAGGSSGFGRILALRNMEINRDRNNSRQHYNQSSRS